MEPTIDTDMLYRYVGMLQGWYPGTPFPTSPPYPHICLTLVVHTCDSLMDCLWTMKTSLPNTSRKLQVTKEYESPAPLWSLGKVCGVIYITGLS